MGHPESFWVIFAHRPSSFSSFSSFSSSFHFRRIGCIDVESFSILSAPFSSASFWVYFSWRLSVHFWSVSLSVCWQDLVMFFRHSMARGRTSLARLLVPSFTCFFSRSFAHSLIRSLMPQCKKIRPGSEHAVCRRSPVPLPWIG